jgi:hypothetical protein
VRQGVHTDDVACPEVTQRCIEHLAHRALADDDHILTDDVSQLVEGVQHRAEELAHKQHIHIAFCWQSDAAPVVVGQGVLLEQAPIKAVEQDPLTLGVPSGGAGDYPPQPLVSGAPRLHGILTTQADPGRFVCTADRRALQMHKHRSRCRLRDRLIEQFPTTRCCEPS